MFTTHGQQEHSTFSYDKQLGNEGSNRIAHAFIVQRVIKRVQRVIQRVQRVIQRVQRVIQRVQRVIQRVQRVI